MLDSSGKEAFGRQGRVLIQDANVRPRWQEGVGNVQECGDLKGKCLGLSESLPKFMLKLNPHEIKVGFGKD